jgi:regulator of replication initiation timing
MEEGMQRKTREIYELTVQIGALKEENRQVKREVEEVRDRYEERLAVQNERAHSQQAKVMDEY